MTEPAFRFFPGTEPLLISMPHVGTHVPPDIAQRMTPEARRVPDTDWNVDRLYGFARELGASLLVATHSRYVIDLNRPPDGASLYPGQTTTGLCPLETYVGTPIYLDGQVPDDTEIARRRELYWRPYHEQLATEIERLKAQFGVIGFWDAHSIRSVLPRFFEGKLPDLNLGTNDGKSCAPALQERLTAIVQSAQDYTASVNGRYKGGYITRNYGHPADHVHAVQLEMAQCVYMQEELPFAYDDTKARQIQPYLQKLLGTVLSFVKENRD